jgi:hypothetical protein
LGGGGGGGGPKFSPGGGGGGGDVDNLGGVMLLPSSSIEKLNATAMMCSRVPCSAIFNGGEEPRE